MITSILRLFGRPSPEETARDLLRELLHLDEVERSDESAEPSVTRRPSLQNVGRRRHARGQGRRVLAVNVGKSWRRDFLLRTLGSALGGK